MQDGWLVSWSLTSLFSKKYGYIRDDFHARLSDSKHLLKNIHPVTLASLLFTVKKAFTMANQKRHRIIDSTLCSNQEGRHCNKTPVHKINVQSLMASVSEPQVADSTPVSYLSIMKAYYRNMMLLQQFPLAVLQISSKFFIF